MHLITFHNWPELMESMHERLSKCSETWVCESARPDLRTGPAFKEQFPVQNRRHSQVIIWGMSVGVKNAILPDGSGQKICLCDSLWSVFSSLCECEMSLSLIDQSLKGERGRKRCRWFIQIFHNYDSAWMSNSTGAVKLVNQGNRCSIM